MFFNRLLKGNRCWETPFTARDREKINLKLFGVCKLGRLEFFCLFFPLKMLYLEICAAFEMMVGI